MSYHCTKDKKTQPSFQRTTVSSPYMLSFDFESRALPGPPYSPDPWSTPYKKGLALDAQHQRVAAIQTSDPMSSNPHHIIHTSDDSCEIPLRQAKMDRNDYLEAKRMLESEAGVKAESSNVDDAFNSINFKKKKAWESHLRKWAELNSQGVENKSDAHSKEDTSGKAEELKKILNQRGQDMPPVNKGPLTPHHSSNDVEPKPLTSVHDKATTSPAAHLPLPQLTSWPNTPKRKYSLDNLPPLIPIRPVLPDLTSTPVLGWRAPERLTPRFELPRNSPSREKVPTPDTPPSAFRAVKDGQKRPLIPTGMASNGDLQQSQQQVLMNKRQEQLLRDQQLLQQYYNFRQHFKNNQRALNLNANPDPNLQNKKQARRSKMKILPNESSVFAKAVNSLTKDLEKGHQELATPIPDLIQQPLKKRARLESPDYAIPISDYNNGPVSSSTSRLRQFRRHEDSLVQTHKTNHHVDSGLERPLPTTHISVAVRNAALSAMRSHKASDSLH